MSNLENLEPGEARGKRMRVRCPCGTVFESIDITPSELEGLNYRLAGGLWHCHLCAGLPVPPAFREAWRGPDGARHIGGQPSEAEEGKNDFPD